MTGKRLTLLTDDPRFAQSFQSAFVGSTGLTALVCRFDSLLDQVGPGGDEPVVVAVAANTPPETLTRVVQTLRMLRLPPPVIVTEGQPTSIAQNLRDLSLFVGPRFSWPGEAGSLIRLVREQLGRHADTHAPGEEPVMDLIRRRLLAFTPSLVPMLECITLAAMHEITVLLTGETGTGKTFLARLMHDCSPRRQKPFLVVPCGAQPASLVESVFFGHTKGAFTGADRGKEGKFAAAAQGTLLLDEIDTLPLEAQAGLLRVIETGEYEPVGSNETLRSEARVIVASNWDLEHAARQGKFRSDLYYRLNVLSFHLPPLRERVQDIAPLVRAMAARYNLRFQKSLFDIRPEALAALEGFDWPGNIRQLENVVQQAVLVSKGATLLAEDLPPLVRPARPAPLNGHAHGSSGVAQERPVADNGVTLSAMKRRNEGAEKLVIMRALQDNGFSRTRAAQALGISRVTLYKKMKKYKLDVSSRTGPPIS